MRRILIAAAAAAARRHGRRAAACDLSQSGLVGQLENPTIITDTAQWPKKFQEAPALAELVKAGKLPPVAERLPSEPMVLKPLRSVGKYGGTWRRGFLGPGRQRERQPHPLRRQAAVLGRHRHQDHARRRQGLGVSDRRQAHDASPCARG